MDKPYNGIETGYRRPIMTQQNLEDLDLTNTQDQVGANALGLKADRVKMIGTAQQKQGAFKDMGLPSANFGARGTSPSAIQVEPPKPEREKTLEWSKLTKQTTPSQQQLAMAQQNIATNEQLKQMGSLGASIQGILMGKLNTMFQAPEAKTMFGISSQDITKENMKVAQDAISNIISGNYGDTVEKDAEGNITKESKASLMGKLNTALGRSRETALSIEDLATLFKDKDTAVSEAIAGGLSDVIHMDRGMLESMGYGDEEIPGLLSVLGTSENDLSNLTVQDFQKKVNEVLSTEVAKGGTADALIARLNDPYTSESQKEVIREQLAQMGASGEYAAEAQAQSLMDQISSATEKLTIGDTTGTLEELLSDEKVSNMVVDYLQLDEKGRKDSNLPQQLKDLINSNEDLFKSTASQLETDVKSFEELQTQSQTIGFDEEAGNGIPEGLLEDMFPQLAGEGFLTEAIDTSEFEGLGFLNSKEYAPAARRDFISSVQSLYDSGNSDMAKTLLKLPPDKLAKLEFNNPVGESKDYIESYETEKEIKAATSIDDIWKAVAGEDSISFSEFVESLEIRSKYGDKEADSLLTTLTENLDTDGTLGTIGEGELDKIKAGFSTAISKYRDSVESEDNIFKKINKASKIEPGELPEDTASLLMNPNVPKTEMLSNISSKLGKDPTVGDLEQLKKAYPLYAEQIEPLIEYKKGADALTTELEGYTKDVPTLNLSADVAGLETQLANINKFYEGFTDLYDKNQENYKQMVQPILDMKNQLTDRLQTEIVNAKREQEAKRVEEIKVEEEKKQDVKEVGAKDFLNVKTEFDFSLVDPTTLTDFSSANLDRKRFLTKKYIDKINKYIAEKGPTKAMTEALSNLTKAYNFYQKENPVQKSLNFPSIDAWRQFMSTNTPGINKNAYAQDTLYRIREQVNNNPIFADEAKKLRKEVLSYITKEGLKVRDYAAFSSKDKGPNPHEELGNWFKNPK